jgi:hypothetical protein
VDRSVACWQEERRRGASTARRCRPVEPTYYEIVVLGVLDSRWSAWFEGLEVTSDSGQTRIAGPVADQAALHGLLAKVRDLGLPLLSVRHIEPHQ